MKSSNRRSIVRSPFTSRVAGATPAAFTALAALLGLIASGALTACTSLASVSVTQIPVDRSRPVHAEVSNTAFLGLHFDNSFVDELQPDLMRQCPNGRLTGILTKHANTSYFIVSTRSVKADGYCVYDPPPAARAPSLPTPPGTSAPAPAGPPVLPPMPAPNPPETAHATDATAPFAMKGE